MNKYTLGICAMIKNENDYLEEWLDYHFSLGVSHIWLFEDYGSSSHSDIVEKYNDKVTLQSIQVTGAYEGNILRQCAVYEYFCQTYKDAVDWCAFIDIDEYIVPSMSDTLDKLFDSIGQTDFNGIGLYWKIYNANGHITKPEGKLVDCYTKSVNIHINRNISISWEYKTVVNMKKDIKFWPICHTPGNICDVYGNRIDIRSMKNQVTFDKCYIAHYFTKSWEDWKKRLERGPVAAVNRNSDLFFKMNPDMNDYKDELILSLCKQ